jgi:hypothetical protein
VEELQPLVTRVRSRYSISVCPERGKAVPASSEWPPHGKTAMLFFRNLHLDARVLELPTQRAPSVLPTRRGPRQNSHVHSERRIPRSGSPSTGHSSVKPGIQRRRRRFSLR